MKNDWSLATKKGFKPSLEVPAFFGSVVPSTWEAECISSFEQSLNIKSEALLPYLILFFLPFPFLYSQSSLLSPSALSLASSHLLILNTCPIFCNPTPPKKGPISLSTMADDHERRVRYADNEEGIQRISRQISASSLSIHSAHNRRASIDPGLALPIQYRTA